MSNQDVHLGDEYTLPTFEPEPGPIETTVITTVELIELELSWQDWARQLAHRGPIAPMQYG